jgi:hypothetical protein
MPKKNKPMLKRKGNNKKHAFIRRGPSAQIGRDVSKPTLVLKSHIMINQNLNSVNVKQINIAPTLSSFPIADGQRKYY